MSSIITTLFNKKHGKNRVVRLDMGSILIKGFPIQVEIITDEDLNLKKNYFYSSIANFAKDWEFAKFHILENVDDNQD